MYTYTPNAAAEDQEARAFQLPPPTIGTNCMFCVLREEANQGKDEVSDSPEKLCTNEPFLRAGG